MKKFLTLSLATMMVVLAACTSVLDKKINKDTFLQDIQEIHKKTGNQYSDMDYTNLALGIGVGNVMGMQGLEGTYREGLDHIKAAREKATADSIAKAQKYLAELKIFNEKVGQLTKAINIVVLSKGTQTVNDYDEEFVFHYVITSGASQMVTGFWGKMITTDDSGNQLYSLDINSTEDNIGPGAKIDVNNVGAFNDLDADQNTLNNTPFEKLHFKWEPTKILFKDGTSITAPQEPEKP